MSQYIISYFALELVIALATIPAPASEFSDIISAPITAQINAMCGELTKPANLDCAMEILSNEVEIDYN